MYRTISPGALGQRVNSLQEGIDLAKSAGFEGVEFSAHEVADLIDAHGPEHVKRMFSSAGIRPAAFGLPTEWRGDEAKWRQGLEELPRLAGAARAIGCPPAMTWVMPLSDERGFDENRRFPIEPVPPIAAALGPPGEHLGPEVLGPQ